MARINLRVIPALVFAASLTQLAIAQNPASQSQPQSAQSQTHPESNQASQIQPTKLSFTLRTTTRMVNLELVVEDAKHRHIDGLKASDFNIFEQTPSRSGEKREQKIVEFREVHVADLKPAPASHAAPGIYSNAVTVQKDPVPPTILAPLSRVITAACHHRRVPMHHPVKDANAETVDPWTKICPP